MKHVFVAFEEYDKSQGPVPLGYKRLDCHMIFDVEMNKNFRRKAQMVADGHKTETTASITYLSLLSCDSVHIASTITAFNKLKIQACDIQKAYLTTPCREKCWMIARSEFGCDKGKQMLIVHVLYSLKSSGTEFCAFLAETLHNARYRPWYADPDVWMRPAIKSSGIEYWEYMICYVNDVLVISDDPNKTMCCIKSQFKLKGNKAKELEVYLGASLSKTENEFGNTGNENLPYFRNMVI